MGQTVLRAKNHTPDALVYDGIDNFSFPSATLVNSQANTAIAAALPLGLNLKIVAVSINFTTVAGAAAVSMNVVAGTVAETGLGPPDNSLTGTVPPTVAPAGACLWATDQQVNGASAPVANTCYVLYPVSDGWDIIWGAGTLLTLRVVAGAAAAGTVMNVWLWGKEVDIHPALPNPSNPFAPTAAIL